MIKEKELQQGRQIRFKNGDGVTLGAVQEKLADMADQNAMPVAFRDDQIKFGGLIGGSVEDCVILYHPQHQKDYYNFVIRVKRQGNYAFLNVNQIGVSKMGGKVYGAEAAKAARKGQSMSFKVGSMIGSAIVSAGKSRSKLEEEENWYTIIGDILDEIAG